MNIQIQHLLHKLKWLDISDHVHQNMYKAHSYARKWTDLLFYFSFLQRVLDQMKLKFKVRALNLCIDAFIVSMRCLVLMTQIIGSPMLISHLYAHVHTHVYGVCSRSSSIASMSSSSSRHCTGQPSGGSWRSRYFKNAYMHTYMHVYIHTFVHACMSSLSSSETADNIHVCSHINGPLSHTHILL
jgi:hypothetical protein